MANIRPTGSVSRWNPKTPTVKLDDAPLLQVTVAKDDPDCIPGKDSPYQPFMRGSRKASSEGPFGLGTPGNTQT